MNTAVLAHLLLALVLVKGRQVAPTSTYSRGLFGGPCEAVLGEMRQSGFIVRDCTYLDPFVYWRIEHRMTWTGSRSACAQVAGGDLASVHTFDEKRTVNALGENNYLSSEFSTNQRREKGGLESGGVGKDGWIGTDQGVWIGLRRDGSRAKSRGSNGSGNVKSFWRWADDTDFDYVDWISSQPNRPKYWNSCVQVISVVGATPGALVKGWNDVHCLNRMKAICKAPRVSFYP